MKKILFTAVIISASVFAAYAQDQKTTQQGSQIVKENDQKSQQAKQQEWDNMLKTELKLSDEQLTKLAAINKEFSAKKDAILNDVSLTDDAKKEKKMALKKDKEAKTLEVLSPEQQVKYKQLMEEKMKGTPKKGV